MILVIEHDDHILTHRDEVVMGHLEPAPITRDERKRFKTILQPFSNML